MNAEEEEKEIKRVHHTIGFHINPIVLDIWEKEWKDWVRAGVKPERMKVMFLEVFTRLAADFFIPDMYSCREELREEMIDEVCSYMKQTFNNTPGLNDE